VRRGGAARAVADVLRFAIAAILFASAAGKLLDVGGFAEVLRISNCGCFGVYLPRPVTWATVAEDAALVLFSLLLFALARRNEPATAPKPI